MLSTEDVALAAQDLDKAETDRKQIGLLSRRFEGMTMDDAYLVQDALVARKLARGQSRIGWKIGLTSKAMQSALNINIPDSGVLLDPMRFENKASIPKGHFIQPRIEAEIAFVMKSDLSDPNVTEEDIIAATDYVTPSIEILDTRIIRVDSDTGKTRSIVDTIADNAANAGVVLGEERHLITKHDLRWVGAIVKKQGEVEETGLGAGVLDNPVTSVLWLARRMKKYGQTISAGDVVLSGSFVRPVEATPGSEFYADFGEFGSVSLHFA